MKFLIVSEDLTLRNRITPFIEKHGGDQINYRNARKAIDNLEEISPDVVFFNALDFPRHWKVALHYLREERDYRNAIFILLIQEDFPEEEALKASWLGANGLVKIDEIEKDNYHQFYKMISRYMDFPEVSPPEKKQGDMVFLNPYNLQLCSGNIKAISSDKYRFKTRDNNSIRQIHTGMMIKDCSIKWEKEIEVMDFKVLSQNGNLLLEKVPVMETLYN